MRTVLGRNRWYCMVSFSFNSPRGRSHGEGIVWNFPKTKTGPPFRMIHPSAARPSSSSETRGFPAPPHGRFGFIGSNNLFTISLYAFFSTRQVILRGEGCAGGTQPRGPHRYRGGFSEMLSCIVLASKEQPYRLFPENPAKQERPTPFSGRAVPMSDGGRKKKQGRP